jgi:hypothetical protein
MKIALASTDSQIGVSTLAQALSVRFNMYNISMSRVLINMYAESIANNSDAIFCVDKSEVAEHITTHKHLYCAALASYARWHEPAFLERLSRKFIFDSFVVEKVRTNAQVDFFARHGIRTVYIYNTDMQNPLSFGADSELSKHPMIYEKVNVAGYTPLEAAEALYYLMKGFEYRTTPLGENNE